MLFSDIKKILSDAQIVGKLNKKRIKYITDHSKNTNQNTLLVVDTNKDFKQSYIKQAISTGLNTIITNSYFKNIRITQIVVKDLNKDVLKILKLNQPFSPKKIIAITGTNGKTSVTWYLAQICKLNSIPIKMTGTLGYYQNLKKIKDTNLTTPHSLDLYQFAFSNKKNNNFFISEASSHGLCQGRLNYL